MTFHRRHPVVSLLLTFGRPTQCHIPLHHPVHTSAPSADTGRWRRWWPSLSGTAGFSFPYERPAQLRTGRSWPIPHRECRSAVDCPWNSSISEKIMKGSCWVKLYLSLFAIPPRCRLHTYIHTYTPTYTHTHTHTYIHTHTHLHTYIHTNVHTNTATYDSLSLRLVSLTTLYQCTSCTTVYVAYIHTYVDAALGTSG